jgi:hypothetical protein
MAQVFAGFVAGYALALITTPLVALMLLQLRNRNEFLQRLFPRETNIVAIAVILHGALTVALTALGIVLGLMLLAMRDGPSGIGSLNWPFTVFVCAMALAVTAPVYALLRPLRRLILGYALIGVAIFGWLTPYLAEWSKFTT